MAANEELLLPVIHARGHGRQLDRVFDLVRSATNPKPLTECIDDLVRQLSVVFSADVCSVYLREGDDLVMRGNVGFPATALTDVRLAIGEGITGMAVECMRPISIAVARNHDKYRHFPNLGEDQYPIFVAVPLAGSHGPLGALVLQRRQPPPFSAEEIDLAVALTAPICAAVQRSHLVGDSPPDAAHRRARRVTLAGRTIVRGRAFGRCLAARRVRPAHGPEKSGSRTRRQTNIESSLDRAISTARRLLDRQQQKASGAAEMFAMCRSILDDARLRGRLLEICQAQGTSLIDALAKTSGEAARAATKSGDEYTVARAQAISDIGEVLSHLISEDGRGPHRGSVLLAERLTIFELLLAQPAAIVLAGPASDRHSQEIAAAIDVPTIADIPAIYRWVADGDTVVVDAHHGLVRVNPGRAEIAKIREQQRGAAATPPP